MMFDDQPPVAYGEGVLMGKLHDSPTLVETLQRTYTLALGDALPARSHSPSCGRRRRNTGTMTDRIIETRLH